MEEIDPDDERLVDLASVNPNAQEIRPAMPLSRQWNLIKNFGNRDLKAKFNSTWLGWMWSLVVPMATLLIYTLVFAIVFKMTPPQMGNGRSGIFAIWLFAGLILWSFFNSSINGGIGALASSGGLLSKIYFPAYAPVLGSGLAVGVQSLIELGILLAVYAALQNIGWTWLLAPFVLALFVIFCQALAIAIAIWNIYLRDMAHLVNVALQLLFYVSPIIYVPTAVPPEWRGIPIQKLIMLNPLADFIMLFRAHVYDLQVGTARQWIGCVVWTALAVLWAWSVYRRRGGDLAEAI